MVLIFLGNGDGTFEPPTNLLVLDGVNAVMVGDFNHDGVADLAVNYAQENAVSILLGNGDGTLSAPPRPCEHPSNLHEADRIDDHVWTGNSHGKFVLGGSPQNHDGLWWSRAALPPCIGTL
jgi:hypothetical protein